MKRRPVIHLFRSRLSCSAALLCGLAAGCARNSPPAPVVQSPLQPNQPMQMATTAAVNASPRPANPGEPGVTFTEVALGRAADSFLTRLWIYRPAKPATEKLPCVFVAPAGTTMLHGIGLGDGDRPEHWPYARAGLMVVAYEIDGTLPAADANGKMPLRDYLKAVQAFKRAKAGVLNAQAAIDYAMKYLPVEPRRLFVAGHSSAATLALQVAQNEPRIAACAAYAPICDFELAAREGSVVSWAMEDDKYVPYFSDFIKSMSPQRNAARLRCPLFLFHAANDSRVSTAEVNSFTAAVRRTNRQVTQVNLPQGDHYTPMIREGIPRAIAWFRSLK